MTARKNKKTNNKNSSKHSITLLGKALLHIIIMPLPLVIAIRTTVEVGLNLYTGLQIPLILLGAYMAFQLSRLISNPFKFAPIFGSWQDDFAYYLGITVFGLIFFYPSLIGVDNFFIYFLFLFLALPPAVLVSYLVGSKNWKKKIRKFPKKFKRKKTNKK